MLSATKTNDMWLSFFLYTEYRTVFIQRLMLTVSLSKKPVKSVEKSRVLLDCGGGRRRYAGNCLKSIVTVVKPHGRMLAVIVLLLCLC